ncbi:MAG: hypothetical protein QXZ10_02860 [Sulfolobales archaeon]
MCVERPIEGFMFRHQDHSLWVIKGCYHPEGGLIAIPRFLYGGLKYKKLSDVNALILRYYRHYVKSLYELGREVPLVPFRDIAVIINPLDVVEALKKSSNKEIIKSALELLSIIAEGCGCIAGFSGSLAGGYFTNHSDIDLVIYSNTLKCYELLSRLRYEGVLRPLSYEQAYSELLEIHDGIDLRFVNLMRKRVLQGVFKGFKYTVRLVRCEGPIILKDYMKLSNVMLLVIISDITCSYTTPAYYVSKVVSSNTYYVKVGSEVILMTHRIRFTELSPGSLLLIHAPIYVMSGHSLVNLDIATVRIIS